MDSRASDFMTVEPLAYTAPSQPPIPVAVVDVDAVINAINSSRAFSSHLPLLNAYAFISHLPRPNAHRICANIIGMFGWSFLGPLRAIEYLFLPLYLIWWGSGGDWPRGTRRTVLVVGWFLLLAPGMILLATAWF
jgi:hypothetical protein